MQQMTCATATPALAIETSDGGGWRTDFGALRRVAGVQVA
jgi:hypothetical protein